MTKRTQLGTRVLGILADNLGITVFGMLVPLLGLIADFFHGKEAIFGAVAGVYWIPPLRQAALKWLDRGRDYKEQVAP